MFSVLQPLDPVQMWAVAVAIMVWISTGLGGAVVGPVGR